MDSSTPKRLTEGGTHLLTLKQIRTCSLPVLPFIDAFSWQEVLQATHQNVEKSLPHILQGLFQTVFLFFYLNSTLNTAVLQFLASLNTM